MKQPTAEQKELSKKLWEIKQDESFLMSVMAFAMNLGCESVLIEAIDEGDLQDEQDFYNLIQLAFDENKEN